MSTPAIWDWIRAPLKELEEDCTARLGQPRDELRQAFLDRLGLHEVGQNPVAGQFQQRRDEAARQERSRTPDGDDLESMACELVQEHGGGREGAGYDEQEWQACLAQDGTRWDGTAESRDPFRRWFSCYARGQGLSSPPRSPTT